jgi:hypothetical protein
MNSIAITGHRPQRLKGQERNIKEWAKRQLKKIKPDVVYCGMAQGVDQIIGHAAKDLNIPIICCYAYPKKYFHPLEEYIMNNNETIFVSPEYTRKAYNIRDKFMVDHADILLCVWDGKPYGSTYETREYAQKLNKTIIDYEGLK